MRINDEFECPKCDGWVGLNTTLDCDLVEWEHDADEPCDVTDIEIRKAWDDEVARRAERNYESFLSDYYGGSTPVTQTEIHEANRAEKKRLG